MAADPTYDHVSTVETMLACLRSFLITSLPISSEDATRASETVRTAESIGFVLDPTKYRDALFSGSLDRQKQIIDLFIRTRTELIKIFPQDARLLSIIDRKAEDNASTTTPGA